LKVLNRPSVSCSSNEFLFENVDRKRADRFSGAVVVIGGADGNCARFEMSTARVTRYRMFSVVALDGLAVPNHTHRHTRTHTSVATVLDFNSSLTEVAVLTAEFNHQSV